MMETAREDAIRKWSVMEQDRSRFIPEWRQLSEHFLPAHGRFDNDREKRPRRAMTPNNVPMFAARTLGSGLHAGLTSPARPWFKYQLRNTDKADFGPVRRWLDAVENRMRQAFVGSNLYQMLPFLYSEYGVFGTMCGACYEDDRDPARPFRFEWYTVGQYALACDYAGGYDTLSRVYCMPVRNVVEKFGIKNVSPEIARKYNGTNTERMQDVEILHCIEPSKSGQGWDSVYWEKACNTDKPLARRAFAENPILAASWENVYGETYASSCPGMLALGDAKALSIEEISKARAIERHHNPPLQGPAMGGKLGLNLLPGAYNPNASLSAGAAAKISSVYDFVPDINGMRENVRDFEGRVQQAFFTDLFLMLTLDDRNQRATAEEIRARYDEKVLALGPTLEQANNMLRSLMDRVFGIMLRRSMPIWQGIQDGEPLLPMPPPEIEGETMDVEFVSTLHQAMRATVLQPIERFAMFAGQLAQITGMPPDKFDAEQALDEYGAALSVPAGIVRSDEEAAAIAAQRQQAQQAAQMAQMAPAMKDAAQAAQALGNTPVREDSILGALGAIA